MSKYKSFSNWLMPAIITISTVAASIGVFGDISSPIRFVLVFWFLLFCPGMTYVHLLDIEDKFTALILAVALSLALDTAVSLIVLYTNQWSALLIFGILVAITTAGLALQFWKVRPMSARGDANIFS